jgi:hypothetical protein
MEYFAKGTPGDNPAKRPANDPMERARKIVELGRLHDPEVTEFPNDPEEAAKQVCERILIPTPNFRELNGFDDERDHLAAVRILQCQCGLERVRDPFSLGGYRQVKVFFEFCDGLRKGWRAVVVVAEHDHDGKIKRKVVKKTHIYPRRVDAAEEAVIYIRRRQFALASPGE